MLDGRLVLTLSCYNTLSIRVQDKHAESQLLEAEMENGDSEILEPYHDVLVPDSPRPSGGCNSYSEAGPQQQETAFRIASTGQRTPPPCPSRYGNVSFILHEREGVALCIHHVLLYARLRLPHALS